MKNAENRIYKYLDFLKESIGKDDIGVWHISESDNNGVIQLPWFERGKKLSKFINELYNSKLLQTNYIELIGQLKLNSFKEFSDYVDVASLEELKAMATYIIRQDRFNEGLLFSEVKSGLMYKIIKKMDEIGNNG